MKGLILKDLKNTGFTKIEYLITCVIFMILGMFVRIDNLYSIVTYLLIFSGCLLHVFNTKRDAQSKWRKMEKIIPIKTSKLVLARYISYILFMLLGILIVTLYSLGNIYIGVLVLNKSQISLLLLGIGLFFNIGTFFFPLLFKFGENKADGILFLALTVAVLPLRLLMEIGKILLKLENVFYLQNNPTFYIVYVGLTLVMFVCSYFISVKIYKKTEL